MIWLAVALSAMLGELPAPPPEFDAFFKEFAEKRDGIEVLEADFMQKSIVPEEILTTEGSLIYMPRAKFGFIPNTPIAPHWSKDCAVMNTSRASNNW